MARPLHPLARLRLGLTAWYLATFGAILVLLGGGIFVVIGRQFAQQLDDSLHEATVELERAARIREMESKTARGQVIDAVEELHIPERTLYLFDKDGNPVTPANAPNWITLAARDAAHGTSVQRDQDPRRGNTLRLRAERFTLASGAPMVAVAVADKVELEDRYATLIATFGAAAAAALLLVVAGGWFLVRKSTAPVELTIEHMRRFMADAAHELRTPLTIVRSRAEIALQQSRAVGEYEQTLRGIELDARRLGTIVDDLLILARADAGERPIAHERVFLDDLTLDAAGAARVVAQAKGVELELEEFGEAPVDGDPTLLRQLVMILLDNAVKFTARGGSVRVRVGESSDRPTLVVEDTGIGISAEQLPHVFERFYRGDPARSRGNGSVDGAGLGLSIAKWIADAHNAEISVSSEPGAGTRVSVRFVGLGSAA
ncbi:MAG TPA: ATP-binding protein [Gemmatimonadaceae bacterium]|jgi:signal transduction histidine kinase|nr:ATP-binding protein [Gemmatimonadaceae bacterium]